MRTEVSKASGYVPLNCMEGLRITRKTDAPAFRKENNNGRNTRASYVNMHTLQPEYGRYLSIGFFPVPVIFTESKIYCKIRKEREK